MLKRLSGVLAVLLLTSLAWAPSAQSYEPNEGALFNVPRPWGSAAEKERLVTHVEKAIQETPGSTEGQPGGIILISTFLLDRDQSVDALIAACRRGVSVRVILDEDIDNRNSERIIKALNGDNPVRPDGSPRNPETGPCGRDLAAEPGVQALTDSQARASLAAPTDDSVTWGVDRSYAKECTGSCRGAGGNMHSKFYAFSQTGTADNVVIVSSSNLNKGGMALGWNDMYTMTGRPETFEEYRGIHREMTDDDRADDALREFQDGPFTHRFFPMRHASRSNDPTLNDLNRIGCRSALGRTEVHVSQFYWAKDRGIYLANKLLGLARAGCRVSIIHAAVGASVLSRLRDAARRHLISLYDSRWDFNHNGEKEIRAHTKYVLVKGQFGNDNAAHMVMTGTQNWVDGSLSRGDENTLNIALSSAWHDYVQNWNDIRSHSRKFPNHS